jgi:uncharacterized membrane protein YeaQ/YmgE (transglycosylase-associated protein family)
MAVVDIAIWLLTGVIAGWLAGAINPGMPVGGRLAALATATAGALIGGAIAQRLAGMSAVGFLGAALVAVLLAMSIGVRLRR